MIRSSNFALQIHQFRAADPCFLSTETQQEGRSAEPLRGGCSTEPLRDPTLLPVAIHNWTAVEYHPTWANYRVLLRVYYLAGRPNAELTEEQSDAFFRFLQTSLPEFPWKPSWGLAAHASWLEVTPLETLLPRLWPFFGDRIQFMFVFRWLPLSDHCMHNYIFTYRDGRVVWNNPPRISSALPDRALLVVNFLKTTIPVQNSLLRCCARATVDRLNPNMLDACLLPAEVKALIMEANENAGCWNGELMKSVWCFQNSTNPVVNQ